MGDGVVNLRKWDNILQGIVALIVALPGMTFGYLIGGGHGALIGGLAGFVVGGLMAGLVLMYVGWVRRWNSRTPRTKS